ncbi:MAG: helix-turn-helix domain-containing protein [Treponema sp.]
MDYFAVYKEKKNILKVRKAMVKYALEHGMKPAAREFKTTVKTVKKWVKRFREDAENGLINRKQTSKNDDKGEK